MKTMNDNNEKLTKKRVSNEADWVVEVNEPTKIGKNIYKII